ncbi:hypothetical protein BDR22DRAFT_33779 [Usnea florida]
MLLAFPGAFSGIFNGVWGLGQDFSHFNPPYPLPPPHAATYCTWLPRFAEWGLPNTKGGWTVSLGNLSSFPLDSLIHYLPIIIPIRPSCLSQIQHSGECNNKVISNV